MNWPQRDPDEVVEVKTVNFQNGGFVMLASSALFDMTEPDRLFVLDMLNQLEEHESGRTNLTRVLNGARDALVRERNQVTDKITQAESKLNDDGGSVGKSCEKSETRTDEPSSATGVDSSLVESDAPSQFESGPSSPTLPEPRYHRQTDSSFKCDAPGCVYASGILVSTQTHYRMSHLVYECKKGCGAKITGAANFRYHRCDEPAPPIEAAESTGSASEGEEAIPSGPSPEEPLEAPPQPPYDAQHGEEPPDPALPPHPTPSAALYAAAEAAIPAPTITTEEAKPGRFWSAIEKQDRTKICACGGVVGWDRQGGVCGSCNHHYHLWTLSSPTNGMVEHSCPCGSTKTTDDTSIHKFGPKNSGNFTLQKDPLLARK